MALVPLPTAGELSTFSHGEVDVFSVEQRNLAIDQAATLLWIATSIEHFTGDEQVDKIVKWAILDMAWSLLIGTENKSAKYSDFNSERIGSYSYSKATSQVQSGMATGIGWFDAAVTLLLGLAGVGVGAVWSVTEHVFKQPYCGDSNNIFPLRDPSENEDGFDWVDGGTV